MNMQRDIKSIDLTRILGILIDNAIDEVSGIAKDKRREITITFIKSETGVVIIVQGVKPKLSLKH